MDFERIENIIINYFFQSAKMEDLEILNKWIEDPENEVIFQKYIETHFAITFAMSAPDTETVKKALFNEIRKEKRKKRTYRLTAVMKYAAVAILFLGIGFLLQKSLVGHDSENQMIIPGNDAITLRLENGDIKIIYEDSASMVFDANGNVVGEQTRKGLIYANNRNSDELVFNTLGVPNGKRFNVTLSDGTIVHLNAGSALRYPVQLVDNKERKVFLTGEAFFEVAPDTKRPFIVNSNNLDVKAYGTKFNVRNYEEDEVTNVVLVEGSVSLTESGISKFNNEVFLSPGFKATFDKEEKTISQEKVNTTLYTSWMDGNLIFRNETFENIVQKLERHYNVVIINNNEKLARETFNATFETDSESIDQVLNYFNMIYDIDYRIVENKIIIK